MNESVATPELPVQELGRKPRTLHCLPGIPDSQRLCLKLHNPDPEADWDFWLMLISQTAGEAAQLTKIVPLVGGGYRKFTVRVSSRRVEEVRSLRTFTARSDNFGVVHLLKQEARQFYEELRETLFSVTDRVEDFDADGRPVADLQPATRAAWPDLSGDGEISDLLRSLSPTRRTGPLADLGLGVHFATVDETAGELEVADGEVFLAADRDAARLTLQPGIVLETSHQDGVPTLVTNDYFRIDPGGQRQRLFGDRCTQRVYERLLETYVEKKKRGFFRSRHKLRIVRQELRISDFTWEDT